MNNSVSAPLPGHQSAMTFLVDKRARLLLSLYISQYIGMGFIFAAVPVIVRARGLSLDDIAAFYSIAMLWALKFLWAPLVDRYKLGGRLRYKRWLIVAQAIMAGATLACALFDPISDMGLLSLCVAIICLSSAVQDVAADAVAVRLLAPAERGLGNAVQTAGGLLGALIGAGGAVLLYDSYGWQVALVALGLLALVPMAEIMRMPDTSHGGKHDSVTYRVIWQFLGKAQNWRWIAILAVVQFGIGAQIALINPLLSDHGWSLTRIAVGTAFWGALFGIIGAALAALIIRRTTRQRAMVIMLFLCIPLDLPLYLWHAPGIAEWKLIGALAAYYTSWGLLPTMVATVMMDHCRPQAAGSDYSTQFSIGAFVGLLGSALSLSLTETHGYSMGIALGTAFFIMGAIIIGILKIKNPT